MSDNTFTYPITNETYIDYRINGVAKTWNYKFIMPTTVTWENGTTSNFIELFYQAVGVMMMYNITTSTEGEEVIINLDYEKSTEVYGDVYESIIHIEYRYEASTGVLNNLKGESSASDLKLEIARKGYETENFDLIPYASIWFVSASILAIPVIARSRRKD
jgi:hypothetical protein